MEEYFQLGHAEPVPTSDASKSHNETYYLPMHAVHKPSSTTTKLRVMFDAKTSTGVSLNDILMVGPTVYPPLVDILLRFQSHPIALTADLSKMYQEFELSPLDRDLQGLCGNPVQNKSLRITTWHESPLEFLLPLSQQHKHFSKQPTTLEQTFQMQPRWCPTPSMLMTSSQVPTQSRKPLPYMRKLNFCSRKEDSLCASGDKSHFHSSSGHYQALQRNTRLWEFIGTQLQCSHCLTEANWCTHSCQTLLEHLMY